MYEWLKLLHIVAAIVAVGTNLTYFFWLSRIRRDPAGTAPVASGIKALDARFANVAYVVLPLTGVLMVLDADLGFSSFWIATAIGLYVAMGVIAGVLFSPALRRQGRSPRPAMQVPRRTPRRCSARSRPGSSRWFPSRSSST